MTKDNTRDTMNWKPMTLFAAIALLGTGAAIALSQAPFWFGIGIGIATTAGLASLTLAFLHGVKNYKQARGC